MNRVLRDKLIYPSTEQHTVVDGIAVAEPQEYGMTYREYLIAQIAGNSAMIMDGTGFKNNAQLIILQADAILKELEVK